jgi:hypothetical protein
MSDVINVDAVDVFQKYSKDGEFRDPVVMCDACQALLLRVELKSEGMCKHCGNTRVRNVRAMSEGDMALAKVWAETGKIDPDWLKLFEGVPS